MNLVKSYVESINKGSVSISNAWETLVKTECDKAFTNAITYYKHRMAYDVRERSTVLEMIEFDRIHKEHEDNSWKIFFNGALGYDKSVYESQLKSAINEEYTSLIDFLKRSSQKYCASILNDLLLNLDKKVNAEDDYQIFESFEKDVNDLIQKVCFTIYFSNLFHFLLNSINFSITI